MCSNEVPHTSASFPPPSLLCCVTARLAGSGPRTQNLNVLFVSAAPPRPCLTRRHACGETLQLTLNMLIHEHVSALCSSRLSFKFRLLQSLSHISTAPRYRRDSNQSLINCVNCALVAHCEGRPLLRHNCMRPLKHSSHKDMELCSNGGHETTLWT